MGLKLRYNEGKVLNSFANLDEIFSKDEEILELILTAQRSEWDKRKLPTEISVHLSQRYELEVSIERATVFIELIECRLMSCDEAVKQGAVK